MALEQFDIERYVEENVGAVITRSNFGEELRLYCPFCPSHDPDRKGKLYVNIDKKTVFCQRCRYGKGIDTIQFICDVEGCSRAEAIRKLVSSISHSYGSLDSLIERLIELDEQDQQLSVFAEQEEVSLPPKAVQLFKGKRQTQRAERYLIRRGLSRAQLKRHTFFYCGSGKYKNRLVIPLYIDGRLVHWVARDLSGKRVKYRTPPGVNQSFYFFNWDRAKIHKRVVVVEGVFDFFAVERARLPCVVSYGKGLSDRQAELLSRFEEVVMLYDSEATYWAYKASDAIVGPRVRIAKLSSGDPGDFLKRGNFNELRRLIIASPFVDSPEGMSQFIESMV